MNGWKRWLARAVLLACRTALRCERLLLETCGDEARAREHADERVRYLGLAEELKEERR